MNFNGAQIHLLINHFPVVGFPLVLLVFLWSLYRKESQSFILGIFLTFIVWVTTLISYFTGEGAEKVLHDLPNFNIDLIHTHEDTAFTTMILSSIIMLLGLCLLPLVQNKISWLQKSQVKKTIKIVFVVALLVICILLALAAHQGGLIRHSEIRT